MRMNERGWRPAEIAEIQNHLTNKSWTEIDASEVPHGRRWSERPGRIKQNAVASSRLDCVFKDVRKSLE